MMVGRRLRSLEVVQQVSDKLGPLCFGRSLTVEDLSRFEGLPDHDLKILDALIQRKENEIARKRLSDRYNQLWTIESETRKKELAEAESQYRKLLLRKREAEQRLLQHRKLEREKNEEEAKSAREKMLQEKLQKFEKARASQDEAKMSQRVRKSLTASQRFIMAEWRRMCKARLEAANKLKIVKTQNGKQRQASLQREQFLWDNSKRITVVNWLSQKDWERCKMEWETKRLEEEAIKLDRIKREEERVERLKKEKRDLIRRSREQAQISSALRRAVLSMKDMEALF